MIIEQLLAYRYLSGAELLEKAVEEMKKEKTEEQIRKDIIEMDIIMEEVMHDPEVAQAAEEAQREFGTLTPEEMRRQFTI